jgi:hypothetical protein
MWSDSHVYRAAGIGGVVQDAEFPIPTDSQEYCTLFAKSHFAPHRDILAGTTVFCIIILPKKSLRACEWFDSAGHAESIYSYLCLYHTDYSEAHHNRQLFVFIGGEKLQERAPADRLPFRFIRELIEFVNSDQFEDKEERRKYGLLNPSRPLADQFGSQVRRAILYAVVRYEQ